MNKLDEILTIYRVKHSKLINLCDDGEITEEQYSEGLLDIRMEAKQAIIELIEGEIIGELEEMRTKETLELHSARNLLKLAQRQKLQKLKE